MRLLQQDRRKGGGLDESGGRGVGWGGKECSGSGHILKVEFIGFPGRSKTG